MNKYLLKCAILLTQYKHSKTGQTKWVTGYKPIAPGASWTKTKNVKYMKAKGS